MNLIIDFTGKILWDLLLISAWSGFSTMFALLTVIGKLRQFGTNNSTLSALTKQVRSTGFALSGMFAGLILFYLFFDSSPVAGAMFLAGGLIGAIVGVSLNRKELTNQ